MIGVGITTHNRPDVFRQTYKNILRFLPPDAKLAIVDDASTEPVDEAAFRFHTNVGVARAKNKCLELLDDCDDIFLFDDDCWPTSPDWYKPYIASAENHLMYVFEKFAVDMPGKRNLSDCERIYQDSKIVAYSHARGCMLYVKHKVLEVVGGFDAAYGTMYEHGDWSNRIFNAGLTSFRIMDVPGSGKLFHSMDEWRETHSSIKPAVRDQKLGDKENRKRYAESYKSTKFAEYRDYTSRNTPINATNIILTCYFTGQPDPARGITWEPDTSKIAPLYESVAGQEERFVLLHDCFDQDNEEFVRVETRIDPYFQRWLSYYQYLRAHPEVDKVFCVDATDVEMLRAPFKTMNNLLYTGDETGRLNDTWMRKHHRVPLLQTFLNNNPTLRLLNAGILGGPRDLVMKFCHRMTGLYFDNGQRLGDAGDMGAFNYLAYTEFREYLSHGRHVNTKFKANEYNDVSWFKHK